MAKDDSVPDLAFGCGEVKTVEKLREFAAMNGFLLVEVPDELADLFQETAGRELETGTAVTIACCHQNAMGTCLVLNLDPEVANPHWGDPNAGLGYGLDPAKAGVEPRMHSRLLWSVTRLPSAEEFPAEAPWPENPFQRRLQEIAEGTG